MWRKTFTSDVDLIIPAIEFNSVNIYKQTLTISSEISNIMKF